MLVSTSVKKCAQIIILHSPIIKAKIKNTVISFLFFNVYKKANAIENDETVCPEGKEVKQRFVEKK